MAYQRQGLSSERTHVTVDHYVHHRLSGDEDHKSGHCCLRKMVVAVTHYDRASRKEAYVQDDYQQSSEQSIFFHDEAEHVVFEHDRNDVSLCAPSGPLADQAAFVNGNLGADGLLELVQGILEFSSVLRRRADCFKPFFRAV